MRRERTTTLLTLLTLLCVAALGSACAEGGQDALELEFEQAEQGIRNGTREPTATALSEGQKLAIGWLHRPGSPGGNFCTGTLIAPNVVITAEHCTNGASASQFAFGIGLLPADYQASFDVAEVVEHPQVDAAMLILTEDAPDRVPALVPIDFNSATLGAQHEGMVVEASGYGETYDPNREGRYFAAIELETVGPRYVVVNGNGERGICFGDSGGPLLAMNNQGQPVVLAVESNGEDSCVGRDNMTRLDVLASWISPYTGSTGSSSPIGEFTAPDNCGGLNYLGRCTGTTAEWCEDNQLKSRNCASEGLGCGFVDDEVGYYCIDPTPEPECTPSDVYCDGDVRIRCVNGEFVRDDCTRLNAICTFDNNGAAVCLNPDTGNNSANNSSANNSSAGNNGASNNAASNNAASNNAAVDTNNGGPAWTDNPGTDGDVSFVDEPGSTTTPPDPTIRSTCAVAPTRTNGAMLILLALAVMLGMRR